MATPPSITPEQRQAALVRAAEVRALRAEVKNKLKMGLMSLPEVLAEADRNDDVAGIKVVAVLQSLPGIGKVRARRTMEDIGIADTRRLRGLGSGQKERLLQEFGG